MNICEFIGKKYLDLQSKYVNVKMAMTGGFYDKIK